MSPIVGLNFCPQLWVPRPQGLGTARNQANLPYLKPRPGHRPVTNFYTWEQVLSPFPPNKGWSDIVKVILGPATDDRAPAPFSTCGGKVQAKAQVWGPKLKRFRNSVIGVVTVVRVIL